VYDGKGTNVTVHYEITARPSVDAGFGTIFPIALSIDAVKASLLLAHQQTLLGDEFFSE
jgi:hypothetical protein